MSFRQRIKLKTAVGTLCVFQSNNKTNLHHSNPNFPSSTNKTLQLVLYVSDSQLSANTNNHSLKLSREVIEALSNLPNTNSYINKLLR